MLLDNIPGAQETTSPWGWQVKAATEYSTRSQLEYRLFHWPELLSTAGTSRLRAAHHLDVCSSTATNMCQSVWLSEVKLRVAFWC